MIEIDDQDDPREEKDGQQVGCCQVPDEDVDRRAQESVGGHEVDDEPVAEEAHHDHGNEEADLEGALPRRPDYPQREGEVDV